MALTDLNSDLPRIKLNKPLNTRDLIKYINARSGFVASDIVGMIYELHDVLLDFLRDGTPVRLEGIGIFSPSVKLDGKIKINFRADKGLIKELNLKHNLKRKITNRKNLGKTLSELEKMSRDNKRKLK